MRSQRPRAHLALPRAKVACALACGHTSSVASWQGLALSVGGSREATLGGIVAVSPASPHGHRADGKGAKAHWFPPRACWECRRAGNGPNLDLFLQRLTV